MDGLWRGQFTLLAFTLILSPFSLHLLPFTISTTILANNYFQFQQFIIYQDKCAMKVCTDACIFGAYVARKISHLQLPANNILDIGAGTGLLSLMAAQKTTAIIDSVEMEEAAFVQAAENFQRSPWTDRLHIFKTDILKFYPHKKYDCIISNPPFFAGDLKSGNQNKNAAKHDTTLTLEQLLAVIDSNLSNDGFFAVLLPYHRVDFFIAIAQGANYFLKEQLSVRHTETHPYFRGILFFSKTAAAPTKNTLSIKETTGNYTSAFIKLLQEYYLEEGLRSTPSS